MNKEVYSVQYKDSPISRYETISINLSIQGARDALSKYLSIERNKYAEYIIDGRDNLYDKKGTFLYNKARKYGMSKLDMFKSDFRRSRDWKIVKIKIDG